MHRDGAPKCTGSVLQSAQGRYTKEHRVGTPKCTGSVLQSAQGQYSKAPKCTGSVIWILWVGSPECTGKVMQIAQGGLGRVHKEGNLEKAGTDVYLECTGRETMSVHGV